MSQNLQNKAKPNGMLGAAHNCVAAGKPPVGGLSLSGKQF